MKKRTVIILILVSMCIVFAVSSVTFITLGRGIVSENEADYDVIFTSAILDNEDVYDNVISSDKRKITFSTKDLTEKGDTSVLSYVVKNNSKNYDAEVRVECTPLTSEYTFLKNEFTAENNIIESLRSESGRITITVKKMPMEIIHEEYKCELVADPIERVKLGYAGETEWTFDYTGGEQTFVTPAGGVYVLETWGAQGGASNTTYIGGYGGYSTGKIVLPSDKKIYINVGGKGGTNSTANSKTGAKGGYNGGGTAKANTGVNHLYGAGGGATHIALSSGLLSTFENNQDDLLIVSGGGGGGRWQANYAAGRYGYGGSGGGYIGVTAYDIASKTNVYGGTQEGPTEGGAKGSFGQGGVSTAQGAGGGGYYGGNVGGPGGGGSGYIGNSLLTEKTMYCYNCEESSEESTKTVTTTCKESTATENCAKIGNGYARIRLIY